MKRILLVCTGNICRSPLAEALMLKALEERGRDRIEVQSAGTGAWEGAPASEGAYLVGLEHGLDLSEHRAKLLTKDLVKQADIILTMARHHRQRAQELGGEGRTYLLGEYAGLKGQEAEVGDPFGSGLEVYRSTYDELEQLVEKAADRLVKEWGEERDNADRRE
ncbi:MAG: low molecular weight protein arginine phosphatase [Gemmatimonadales bacterium]